MSGTHVLADALLAGFDAEDELETRNPLECLVCSNEFVDPRRLPCNHSFCQRCITVCDFDRIWLKYQLLGIRTMSTVRYCIRR